MEPVYMIENRYSYIAGIKRPPLTTDYETNTPETAFERQVQQLYLEGHAHLQHEEYGLALDRFRELMALILRTAHPQMPVDPNRIGKLKFPFDAVLVDTFSTKAGELLKQIPVKSYEFPASMVSEKSILPAAVAQQLQGVGGQGLQYASHHGFVKDQTDAALAELDHDNFAGAVKLLQAALDKTPATDQILRGSLLHDLGVLSEKAGKAQEAQSFSSQSIEAFKASGKSDAQVQALDTASGIFLRTGKVDQSRTFAAAAAEIRSKVNINPVFVRPTTPAVLRNDLNLRVRLTPGIGLSAGGGTAVSPAMAFEEEAAALQSTPAAPQLIGMSLVQASQITKKFSITGLADTAAIALDANAAANVKAFHQTLSTTKDLGLLTGFWTVPTQMIAYLPHMYFFVVPMAMGDCLAGMGNLAEAEETYRGTLPYPFINKTVEIVRLWTRLARTYLDQGDSAYRNAKDNVAGFAAAKAFYENIVMGNKTLKPASPLYQDAKFAGLKTRVTTFLAAANPLAVAENPTITSIVLEALSRLQQIAAELNFFGFGPAYVPPFSFEYLQTTARYFAQQASQIEQRYVQFKSTAENEELRREQLDQQADVARQTVILEQRGVAEAQAGINVAQANVNYAEVNRQNAQQSLNDFNAVRWELLELAELEAWGSATSVHTDDQIKFNIDWTYYQSSEKPRNQVLMDLAGQRTRISHDLEAAKLQRAIDAANAYKGVAQAQVTQAQARKAVAEQRVVIAQMQQKFAEENRDFVDMKEFNAGLWYEMASQAKRLSRRYLDMATEIAFLMERAYNAETERGLGVIRYDYSRTPAANLMGADFLLQDIDYFTLDHVTTVRARKALMKKVISVADVFPMAFHNLRTTGSCVFQTELADFDRENPGMYLCKLKNVELLFVGLTGSTSLGGSLRNVGVSKFRREDGTVVTRMYPADVMPLSQYSIRQDALAFRINTSELKLFENNGIDTLWKLELPRNANTFNYDELLDVQIVLYYDGFFSPALETTIKAALPLTGTASRGFAMRMWFPDELFYLKNQGEGKLEFEASMFPGNQTGLLRTDVTLKALGEAATVGGLTLRLTSAVHGAEITMKTDANGEVNASTPGQPLNALRNEAVLDTWTVKIMAADNPGLVTGGVLNLTGLTDLEVFLEYKFAYRN